MSIGLLKVHLSLPGCKSLKEKRSRILPVLSRLRREFNISTAEMDLQDMWQEAVLACVMVSNDPDYTHRALKTIEEFLLAHWPDLEMIDSRIELL